MPATIMRTINSKAFLFCSIVLFLFPFFLLSAWNHPSHDDFIMGKLRTTYSFREMQLHFFRHWNGRFGTTFVSSLLGTTGILYTTYYLNASILLVCTFLAFLFTTVQFNRYLLTRQFSFSSLIILSLLLLILELHVIPLILTQFYWFSSSLTYQVPFILLIFLAGLLVRLFSISKGKAITLVLTIIFILLVNGFNEMLSVFILVLSTPVIVWCVRNKVKYRPIVLTLWLLNLCAASVLFFAPGLSERSMMYSSRSFIPVTGAAIAKFFIINWYFLKEPLWWLFAAYVLLWSLKNKTLIKSLFIQSLQKIPATGCILLYIVVGLGTYIPAFLATNGSIPSRAENAIGFSLGLLLLFIIHVRATASRYSLPENVFSQFYRYRFILFSIFIFSTSQMQKVAQSLISGPFYHAVMKEREEKLRMAAKSKQVVVIDDYELALQKKIKEILPKGSPVTIKKLINEKPSLLFIREFLYDTSVTKGIYGADSVVIITSPKPN